MIQKRPSWDDLFMSIANSAASRSACIHYSIGAVFVDENHRIISIGYNGPSSCDINCSEAGYCVKIDGDPITGKIKRCNGAHAEMNAIVNCGNTMRLSGSTLYTSVFPCYDCMKVLNNAGIKKIIYAENYQRLIDGKKGEKEVEAEALELAIKRGIICEQHSTPNNKIAETPIVLNEIETPKNEKRF